MNAKGRDGLNDVLRGKFSIRSVWERMEGENIDYC